MIVDEHTWCEMRSNTGATTAAGSPRAVEIQLTAAGMRTLCATHRVCDTPPCRLEHANYKMELHVDFGSTTYWRGAFHEKRVLHNDALQAI